MAKQRQSVLDIDIEPLVAALDQARTGAGFEALIYEEVTSVLMSAFKFRAGLTETDKHSVLNRAIREAARTGVITKKRLTDSVRREEETQLALPLKPFFLATHLSFTRHGAPSPRTFRGGISLSFALPNRFVVARSTEVLGLAEEDVAVRNYTGVLVKVQARSTSDAFAQAIHRLDLLRALWNFAHVRRTISGYHSDSTTPLARVRTGRVHTLHNPNGTLATEMYFFNSEHRVEPNPFLSDTDWERMQRYVRSTRQRLPRVKYSQDLERAFVQYVYALDSTDMSMAFLRLWSVLELLTGLGGERYDSLVRRVAATYKPDALTRAVLEHLRYQRNELVHLGTPREDMRPLVYQLKRFVERLLGLHVVMGRHFASASDFGSFLELPVERADLSAHHGRILLAMKFRGFAPPRRRR